MTILILSWRDIKHPQGGGAEDLSHQMAKRWVLEGNKVIHFSALFPGAKEKEDIDGVSYLRSGTWYSVHIIAFFKILTRQFGKFDIIVDEAHGYSFFSVLYSPVPVVCLACEVAKEIWDRMYSFPFNLIGKVIESLYLFFYKNVTFLTISQSSKSLLVAEGINPKKITILPMGFTYPQGVKILPKNKKPTIIFLGRLAKTKGVPDAIQAFSLISQKMPYAQLWIIGKGMPDYEQYLRDLVDKLDLKGKVDFKGFVTESQKFEYLSQAHILLVPSLREGWGLIVPEANLVGTPAIVYNVPGLRDVTKNDINGIVVKENNSESLAGNAIKLLEDQKLYKKISESSKKYAKSLNWDDTAKVSLEVLNEKIS